MPVSNQPLAHTKNPSAARTPTFEQARAAYLANASAGDLKKFFALYFELTAPFQELFDTVFGPPGLWSAFITAPSSMRGHHRERGGNLRHSVEVAEISLLLASRKNIGQQVDRQVQITASLTHDPVAGPVGEALIMTAIGLFVAIPAVFAFNFFSKINSATISKFDTFAHDLHDFFATGSRVR